MGSRRALLRRAGLMDFKHNCTVGTYKGYRSTLSHDLALPTMNSVERLI